ncbi:hypothetical protein BBJ28_00024413 [Nothophytophthora sp. Chile5]|nr:hypothetical protein BBJ28_00024413 [Nothophytophthora sp. Chile5]
MLPSLRQTARLALRLPMSRSVASVAGDGRLRVGIVGAGRIGQVHAQSLQRTSAVIHSIQLPARVRFLSNRAEKIARLYGIPNWTNDASEVLGNPEIDAVLICSPTDRHAEQIIEAAKHKKHIFCEKPVDLNLQAVNKALQAVRASLFTTF